MGLLDRIFWVVMATGMFTTLGLQIYVEHKLMLATQQELAAASPCAKRTLEWVMATGELKPEWMTKGNLSMVEKACTAVAKGEI